MKPLTLVILCLVRGLIALGPGSVAAEVLLVRAGMGPRGPLAAAAAAVDILVGIGIAVRSTARLALWAALVVSSAYLLAGTLLLPALWLDPLGPLLKIAPIALLTLLALAILDER